VHLPLAKSYHSPYKTGLLWSINKSSYGVPRLFRWLATNSNVRNVIHIEMCITYHDHDHGVSRSLTNGPTVTLYSP